MFTYKLCGKPILDVSFEKTNMMHNLFRILFEEISKGFIIHAHYKNRKITLNDYNFDLDNLTLRNEKGNIYSYDTIDDDNNILLLNEPANEESILLYYTFNVVNSHNPYMYYNPSEFIEYHQPFWW
jgi:hypothetical protein